MEKLQNSDWWTAEFISREDEQIDYVSKNGKNVIEVKKSSAGSRGVYSAVMQAAIYLEQNPNIAQMCLVLLETRMSLNRLKDEWNVSTSILRKRIADRLAVIVLEEEGTWINPDTPYNRRIAQHFEISSIGNGRHQWESLKKQPGRKSQELIKLLINRWLLNAGPIALGKLGEDVGCSHPVVQQTLAGRSLSPYLAFTSNRSVELKTFPHDLWQEVVVRSKTFRNSFRFRDRSGTKPSPEGLLKRLERLKPARLAVGGVLSARHWHPEFDLHGTPRLDLVYHAPEGQLNLDFVKAIDPALTQVSDFSESPILVVNPLVRASSLFAERQKAGISWADPVETALDLYDLSLATQANQFLTHLRREVRLA
ncbi:MAG: hypothetical protein U0903_10015 [Planctomycetales bacterium]